MKIAVTGADGFVGRHLQEIIPSVSVATDLRDPQALLEAFRECQADAVVHLAAQSFVPESFQDPGLTYTVNFFGTLNLLTALQNSGFKGRLLFIGTGDAYGLVPQNELPVTEDRALKPRNPYAVSKTAAEALCFQWSQTGPFEIVMARAFNHVGPGQSSRFVVSEFAHQVAEVRAGLRDSMFKVGDLDITRDFTDVRDVVRAYGLLLEKGRSGEVYNICSGTETSIRRILDLLTRIAEVEVRCEVDPGRMRPQEQRRMRGSFEKLRLETGWEPQFSLEQSLRDLLEDIYRKLECQKKH